MPRRLTPSPSAIPGTARPAKISPEDLHAAFLARLRIAIKAAGGTRRVARQIGMSEAQIYRYFAGKPVKSDRIIALATVCNVSMSWLFGDVG